MSNQPCQLRRRAAPLPTAANLRGFILLDWLLAASLLALLTIGVLRFSARELEREEINAVAIQLSAWLQTTQTAAMQLPTAGTQNSSGCQVTINDGAERIAAGEEVASVQTMQDANRPNLCNPEPIFRLPGGRSPGPGKAPQPQVSLTRQGGNAQPILFTPRGTVVNTETVDLVIRHLGQSGAARCVRINAISGRIEIGSANSGTADTCPQESFNDLI